MKSAPFDCIRPDTLDNVCARLASHPDAQIIAGGQSLVLATANQPLAMTPMAMLEDSWLTLVSVF